MRKFGTLLILVLLLTMSACINSDKDNDNQRILEYHVETLELIQKEASDEVVDRLSNWQIVLLEEINGALYIVYSTENAGNNLMSLDANFNIIFELFDIGRVCSITEAYEGHIMIEHYEEEGCVFDIYSVEGNHVFTLSPDLYLREDNHSSNTYYKYLGDKKYLYIKEVRESNLYEEYDIVIASPFGEEVIYTFTAKYQVFAYLLDDNSIILDYENDITRDYVLEHISITGDLIKKEELPYGYSVTVLRDGYLIHTRDYTYKRGFDSEEMWSFETNLYLNIDKEFDGGVHFRVYPNSICTGWCENNEYEYLTIYDDGSSEVEIRVQENSYYINVLYEDDMTRIVFYVERLPETPMIIYHLEKRVDEEIIWSLQYGSRTIVQFIGEYIYFSYPVYEDDVIEFHNVDVIDLEGNIVRTDSVDGWIVSIKENGHYLISQRLDGEDIYGDANTLSEVDQQGNIVWTFENTLEQISYYELKEGISFLSSYRYCRILEPWLCTKHFTSYIIDDSGQILLDFSEQGSHYLKYFDEDYIYIQNNSEKKLLVYDYNLNLIEEFTIIYQTFYYQLLIQDDEIYTIHYPYTLMNDLYFQSFPILMN